MAPRRGPTLRARWLGQELRKLREETNLTLKDVAAYIQRDASSVSRMESGTYPARVPDVLAYLTLCGVSNKRRRDALLTLAHDTWQAGWWDGYTDDVAATLIDRIWLEGQAREIRAFHGLGVPGLLQTRDYAEALIREVDSGAEDDRVQRWLNVRMSRQRILTGDQPVQVKVILEEGGLNRPVGGRTIAAVQLRHLLHQAERPNIEVHVLPTATGAHASPEGSFEIFRMAEPYPDVGCVDTPAGTIYVESETVDGLASRYDRLQRAALGAAESSALIKSLADDIERTE